MQGQKTKPDQIIQILRHNQHLACVFTILHIKEKLQTAVQVPSIILSESPDRQLLPVNSIMQLYCILTANNGESVDFLESEYYWYNVKMHQECL